MGKRKWFSKNKGRGKKPHESYLRAELTRVKSDNEVLLVHNRINESEIEDLQQKIADGDKFMNDANRHVEIMTGRMRGCLDSLNKVYPKRETVNERKPVELDDKPQNGRSEGQLTNMMQSMETITHELETYAQQTRCG